MRISVINYYLFYFNLWLIFFYMFLKSWGVGVLCYFIFLYVNYMNLSKVFVVRKMVVKFIFCKFEGFNSGFIKFSRILFRVIIWEFLYFVKWG